MPLLTKTALANIVPVKKIAITAATVLAILFVLNFPYLRALAVHQLNDNDCEPALVAAARQRVDNLFGAVTSQPAQTCLTKPILGLGHHIATAYFAPGMPTVIVIAPHGQNIDVMAHEWAHAEIAERLGFITRNLALPTWFDEGLAMQVDDREDYSLTALREYQSLPDLIAPQLGDIATTQFFQSGNQGKYHYAYARCLVGSIIARQPLVANAMTTPTATNEDLKFCSGQN